jgi:hypothetical protein
MARTATVFIGMKAVGIPGHLCKNRAFPYSLLERGKTLFFEYEYSK